LKITILKEKIKKKFKEMAFPLHGAIWKNHPQAIKELLAQGANADALDLRGNAPIHLCLQLNRKECLKALLENGNPDCRLQNVEGWSPLSEAISLGNREIIAMVLQHRRKQMKLRIKNSLPQLFGELENLEDFRLEMSWNFRSWVPFISSLCPSDTNLIYKRHSSLRFDTTIAGFEKMRWVRGSLSFLLPGNKDPETIIPNFEELSISQIKEFLESEKISHADCLEKSELVGKAKKMVQAKKSKNDPLIGKLLMVNHDDKAFTVAMDEVEKSNSLDQMINMLMGSPRTTTFLSNEHMEYKRAKSGFWGWQSDKVEDIGGYRANVYDISGIELISKVRSEHMGLSYVDEEDESPESESTVATKNTEVDQAKLDASMEEFLRYKSSLPSPDPPRTTMEDYFSENIESSQIPHLGRPLQVKVKTRSFKSTVWCCENFPLTLQQLITVLKPLAPSSIFVQRILEFLQFDLPPGFPIKIEVPIVPMLSLQVTFQNFVHEKPELGLFLIPLNYVEQDHVL